MKKTVTHLIVGLAKGGAETMLYQLLKFRSDPKLQYRVISLGASHYYEDPIRELGYEVVVLEFGRHPLGSFLRLCKELKNTDTLCCWMYHANLVGYYAGRIAGVKKTVWTIHHSNLDSNANKALTLRINRYCARRSKRVSMILYTGARAREVHEAIGYCYEKGMVVANGCDCEEYRPDACAKESLRAELKLAPEKNLVLSVAKATHIKDVPTFLKAFGILHRQNANLTAVMCGSGVEPGNAEIAALCREMGLGMGEDVYLLGLRHDVARLLAACDLYVLHSRGEAFPVTLVQAMACGCLCVTTDVGDARRILGADAWVVPPEDPVALAVKMAEALAFPTDAAEALRRGNRERARTEFDIREVVKEYERVFSEDINNRVD